MTNPRPPPSCAGVSVLGTSALAVGIIEGIAEATASITKIFSGALSDRLGSPQGPRRARRRARGRHQAGVPARHDRRPAGGGAFHRPVGPSAARRARGAAATALVLAIPPAVHARMDGARRRSYRRRPQAKLTDLKVVGRMQLALLSVAMGRDR
jgi:hypothetical protein